MSEVNWGGNLSYRATRVEHPGTLDEVREIVVRAERVRVLGSRHSFNAIADADRLVSLAALPNDVVVEDGAISFGAGMTYGPLAVELQERSLAIHNLASLPHISVAGAVATGTHGSGNANGNLATAVKALELITSSGDPVTLQRGDDDFDAAVVHLGALGVVTRITLDAQPTFELRQQVFEALGWDALNEHFDAITGAGYSVSVFTRWGETAGAVWVKSTTPVDHLFDARPATVEHHPLPGVDPISTTPQLGVPGRWSDRLPHFRMDYSPSNGAEIQSEYLLPREHALAAIEVLRGLEATITPHLLISEIRTIAADRLWMSGAYERDTVGIHFTWVRDQAAVERALAIIEPALAPFDPRPHWGKVFLQAPPYPRGSEFLALAERYDPRGAFRNPWFEQHVI